MKHELRILNLEITTSDDLRTLFMVQDSVTELLHG